MNYTECFVISVSVIFLLCMLRLYNFNINKRLKIRGTQVFEVSENIYQVIILGEQYRVMFSEYWEKSVSRWQFNDIIIYNYPSGIKLKRGDKPHEFNYIIDSILIFLEQKDVNNRRIKYEKEMFENISNSFSEWDEKFKDLK